MARFFGRVHAIVAGGRRLCRPKSVGVRVFHQLDAIAEWIEDVCAAKVADGRVGARREACALACGHDFIEIVDGERGMRAPRGVKIGVGFDTEMQINGSRDQPDALAPGHRCRLLLFGETENADVKRTRGFFAAGRNRDLHVVEAKDWHGAHPMEAVRRRPMARRRNSCRAVLRRETSGWRAGTERGYGIYNAT